MVWLPLQPMSRNPSFLGRLSRSSSVPPLLVSLNVLVSLTTVSETRVAFPEQIVKSRAGAVSLRRVG